VLFDSGGVLMQPIGGRWNPRADFEETVLDHHPSLTERQFAEAIAAGDRFFAASSSTPDYDDYHRVMLRHLGVDPTERLLADLSREVPPSAVLEVFPDVVETLEELSRRGVRMAVVSDAWPGLPDLHAGLGIDRFFEAYAISAVLGCTKPDPRMYHHASTALGLSPERCLFVDDDPDLVAAAIRLGYAGRAMCRNTTVSAVPSVTSLTQLLDLFEPDARPDAQGQGMDHEPMRRVAEFRQVFDRAATAAAERHEVAHHRRTLLVEEAREAADALAGLGEALRAGDDPHAAYRAVAKELADVLYVTYGAADALGIDLPAVFVEVHRSNMSKRDADGRVLRRADGKVLKGPGYQPPVLDDLVERPSPGS
jgi:HAD superfamily hydrolase (TIGR01509 family)